MGLTYLRYPLVVEVGEILDAYDASLMEMDIESWHREMSDNTTIPRPLQAMLDELGAKAEAALSHLLATQTAAKDEFWYR